MTAASKQGIINMTLKRSNELQARQRRIQIFTLISALFFSISFGASTFNLFSGALKVQNEQEIAESAAAQELQQLQAQETGYESVLQREPNNQTALEGLVNTRLALNDVSGAIAPLEKLIQLHPDRTDYQTALTEVKQKAGDR
jgi:cytochrome c-type biogenesis protein CcmH/NrfG